MHLIFTSVDSDNQVRNFSWWFTSIEIACDVLNSVVAKGNKLIKAELVDQDQRTQLPVQAFDGHACSSAIKALAYEWQEVLSAPVDYKSVHRQQLIGLTRTQIKHYEARITQLELAISMVEQQRQQVEESIFTEPWRSKLMIRNDMALKQYQEHLVTAQLRQQLILDQLSQLQNKING